MTKLNKLGSARAPHYRTGRARHLPRRAMVAMNRVFNDIFRTGHFPETQKGDKVITIPKTGKDLHRPENLRPSTLLSHMAKTFERALLHKLRPFCTDTGHCQFPPPTQFLRCCQRDTIRPLPDPSSSPARQLFIPNLYITYTDDIPTLQIGHLED
ncbi:RNA-directed DNA polymerase from mobile element jockey [Eumeta japonica]|uniref:RNA-directed DNA polymerase from mobile element jockey n=1 Tax=Eumeta variegata TaxID=151549 RepID=A0A4C1TY43_EUMVA|nr:RNA-directed DNA polymerase from mobile element jockey [Eumeta japonica]